MKYDVRIKIDNWGLLYIWRPGGWRGQLCRFARHPEEGNCHHSCPAFRVEEERVVKKCGSGKKTKEIIVSRFHVRLCQNIHFVVNEENFIDEREEVKIKRSKK